MPLSAVPRAPAFSVKNGATEVRTLAAAEHRQIKSVAGCFRWLPGPFSRAAQAGRVEQWAGEQREARWAPSEVTDLRRGVSVGVEAIESDWPVDSDALAVYFFLVAC